MTLTPQQSARRAMRLTLSVDMACAMMAMALAGAIVWLRDGDVWTIPWRTLSMSIAAFGVAVLAGFLLRGIQKQVWRHMGWPDVFALMQAVGLSVLIYLPVMMLLNGVFFAPWETLLVAIILFPLMLLSTRMLALSRSTETPMQLFSTLNRSGQPVVLIGDSGGCVEMLKTLQMGPAQSNVRPLGLVLTDYSQTGRAVRGVPVMGGIDDLPTVLEVLSVRYGAMPWIAVTGHARTRDAMLQFLDVAASKGAKVMALDPNEASHKLKPVPPADLLARPERQLDPRPVQQVIGGASVLVTGGGGTIGSELARQVAAMGPSRLTIMDASEYNLYEIDGALRRQFPDIHLVSHIGDVRDVPRVTDVFQRAQPDIVIHAAALKHVPLMERNLCEAILTNVNGAVNAARAASAVGAKRFVFISTDKAVDPDNVMGATKCLAERAVARIAATSDLAASMVRFGNVLGSSGSVVPLFERQIASGGPVTVTHKDVTRFFMTVEEASSLVLQAASQQDAPGKAGLYVLDMGEPVAIQQLAENMIRLKGLVPGRDIKVIMTGMREGEKMHEVLTYDDETMKPTSIDGVMKVAQRNGLNKLFDKRLSALLEAAGRRERSEALRLLGVLVPEYGEESRDKARRFSA